MAAGRADGFVFGKVGGGFWGGREATARWHDVRLDLELPQHLTLHNLRHTYASTLLAGGMPLVRVAALLGHTPLICARTYAHWIDDDSSEAAEMIERARQGEGR